MDRAMKLADWAGFEARRKEAAKRGKLRGIGISNTIEQAADPTIETAEIRFDPLGGMTFVTGSISHGQGHNTIQTQMLVEPARRRSGADQVHPGRHRRGRLRHGHRRLALDHHERRRHRHGRRQGHRQGQEARRAHAGSGGQPTWSSRTAASPSPAPTAASASTTWRRPRSSSSKLPKGMEPGLYETATYRAHQRQFPERRSRLRGRDRSRHRRDARWSATRWSTTSAPSSTRCW